MFERVRLFINKLLPNSLKLVTIKEAEPKPYVFEDDTAPEELEQEPQFTRGESYCLGLLAEESGEICQMVGKAFRFGLHTPGRKDANGNVDMSITPYTELSKECGDILAAIDFSKSHGIINEAIMEAQYERKLDKLNDPDAKDNLGRPLAPQPNDDEFLYKTDEYAHTWSPTPAKRYS